MVNKCQSQDSNPSLSDSDSTSDGHFPLSNPTQRGPWQAILTLGSLRPALKVSDTVDRWSPLSGSE